MIYPQPLDTVGKRYDLVLCRRTRDPSARRAGSRHKTGNPVIDAFTLPKLLWVMENEPDAFSRASWLLLPKDYVRLKLTGQAGSEPTDAGNTLLLDVRAQSWNHSLARDWGIPIDLLPPLHSSITVVGTIRGDVAATTGLPRGWPVCAGGADMACAALGMGVAVPGPVSITFGTAAQVVVLIAEIDEAAFGRLTFHPHVEPGVFYAMASIFSGSLARSWFQETFSPDKPLDEEALREVPPGSDGLLFLPFLVGAGTPYFDAGMRGAYLGVDLSQSSAHFAEPSWRVLLAMYGRHWKSSPG